MSRLASLEPATPVAATPVQQHIDAAQARTDLSDTQRKLIERTVALRELIGRYYEYWIRRRASVTGSSVMQAKIVSDYLLIYAISLDDDRIKRLMNIKCAFKHKYWRDIVWCTKNLIGGVDRNERVADRTALKALLLELLDLLEEELDVVDRRLTEIDFRALRRCIPS